MRKTIALLLIFGCLQIGAVTWTPLQSADPLPEIILDGPWSSAPNTFNSQVAWDEETGALTLPTDSSRLVFAALPDTRKDAFTNNIYTLGKYKHRLYLGYGDLYNNQGPLNLVSYDPYTGNSSVEMNDVPEDQFGAWLEADDGVFYATGADARESWTFGNFYVNNGVGWRKLRTIYRGLHVNKLVDFSGRLYAAFSSDNQKIVDYPYILVSTDQGLTWNYEKLENSNSQDCTISQMAVVHAPGGDLLYVIAHIIAPPDRSTELLYRFDGKTWEKVDLGKSADDFKLQDIASYQGKLLVTAYTSDTQGRGWAAITYTWDGQSLTEIPYLRGRNMNLALFTEYNGFLYAILNAAQADSHNLTYELVRTADLADWESLGSLRLPEGVMPGAMAFLHNRLYVGGQIAWQEIANNPAVTTLAENQTQPLKNARLTWDADIPAGASLYFQIKAGASYDQYLAADFVGPDGTSRSMFTESGQPLPPRLSGATIFTLQMWKESDSAGNMPFTRTVTLKANDSTTAYAIDQGAGLYTAANSTANGQFTSNVFPLEQPLANARLYFDARIPEGTSVSFQLRSGKTREELEKEPFSGPDGSSASFYTRNGSQLREGHSGAAFIQYRAILASSNPATAPFLRQVRLVNQTEAFESLQIKVTPLSFTAGEAIAVQIEVLNEQGQPLPIDGWVYLSAMNGGNEAPISPDHITLVNGSGKAKILLLETGPTQICLEISGNATCSEPFTVEAGKAAYFDLQAPDLKAEGPLISPHAELGQSFSLQVTARDRYGNLAGDFAGTLSCTSRKWEDINPALIPAYTFTANDQGAHLFKKAVSFVKTGEYSLVCRDSADPAIGGALAITAGNFKPDQFP